MKKIRQGNDTFFSVLVFNKKAILSEEATHEEDSAVDLSQVKNLKVQGVRLHPESFFFLPSKVEGNLIKVEFPSERQELGAYDVQIDYDTDNETSEDGLLHHRLRLALCRVIETNDYCNEDSADIDAPIKAYVLDAFKGVQGEKGERGKDGADGKSLRFEDLTPEQKQELKGEKGERGKDGINGTNGENGRDGRDGVDGRNGIDGENGKSALDYLNENNSEFIEKIKELLPQGEKINYNKEYFNYENMKKILLNYGNHLKDYLIEKEEESLKSRGLGFTLFCTTPQKINIKNHFNTIYKTSDGLVYKPLYIPMPKVKYAPTYIQKDYTISNHLNYKYGIEIYHFSVDYSKANITFVYEYENKNYIYILDFEQIERRKRQKLFANHFNNKIKEYGLAFSDDIETIEGDKLNKLKESYPNLVFAKKAVVSDIIEKVD